MSAQLLIEGARRDLQKQIDDDAEALTLGRFDTLDQLRFRQGQIAGLILARTLLDNRYKDLNG